MPRLSAPVAVLASAAMIASIGAGSYAAGTMVTSKQIKDGTIKVKDINTKAVAELRGKTGPAGPAGAAGAAGAAGPAGPRGFSAWDKIPSGTTVTGYWYTDTHASAANQDFGDAWALGGRAASLLNWSTNSRFKPSASLNDASQGSALCSGTDVAPSAPAGTLCVYIAAASNATVRGVNNGVATDNGFGLRLYSIAGGDVFASGSWAYTAP